MFGFRSKTLERLETVALTEARKETRHVMDLNVQFQDKLIRCEHGLSQYKEMWGRERGEVNNLRNEIRMLNRAIARKNHRIKSLVGQRNQRDLAIADAADQMVQMFHMQELDAVKKLADQVLEDIKYFVGKDHYAAMEKAEKTWAGLNKLMNEPSVLEAPNGIGTGPVEKW